MVDNDSGGSNLVLRDRGIVAPDPNGGGTDLIIVSSTAASAPSHPGPSPHQAYAGRY